MNKRKIEKVINKKLNVKSEFSSIKNKINFEQYTEKIETKKEEKNPFFKINWWQFITPACALIVLLMLAIKDIFPSGNLNKPNNNPSNSIVISNSNSSTNTNQPQISNDSTDENSNVSKPIEESTGGVSISPSLPQSGENNNSLDTEMNPGDGESNTGLGTGPSPEYNAQDGYFKYVDLSIDESVESEYSMSYAYIDTSKSYLDSQKIKINVFLGTQNDTTSTTSILLINKATNQSFELFTIDNFNSINYPIEFITDEEENYVYFSHFIEIELDLSLLNVSEGNLYIGITPNLNQLEKDNLYAYRIIDGYVTFSLFDQGR